MSPRHFSKNMFSPYFQSDHYIEESTEHKVQASIYTFINKLKFWNKNKETDAE
jgi:hypothetical protein